MKEKLREVAKTSRLLKGQSTDRWLVLKDLASTKALGAAIARTFSSFTTVLLLEGPLGVGKTSLIKGLAAEAGIEEPITSPTFSIAQHYPNGNPPLIHLDLYRLENPQEADLICLQEEEEAQAIRGIIAVEWPERLTLQLPEALRISMRYQDKEEGRIAQLSGLDIEATNS